MLAGSSTGLLRCWVSLEHLDGMVISHVNVARHVANPLLVIAGLQRVATDEHRSRDLAEAEKQTFRNSTRPSDSNAA